MVNNSLMPRPHPCREERGLVTIHRTRLQNGVTEHHCICDHALTYAYYRCHVGQHSGAYYSKCAVIGDFTCQMATPHWVWRDVVTRPFSKLSGRVGSGHETRSMQTAVERGWEGSCKAKNKYAPIFLGNPLLASITR